MIRTSHLVPFALGIALTAALAGCSDNAEPQQQASKEPYHPVFNPSPEDKAKHAAEEKARLPLTNELPALGKAERGEYLDMNEPLMAMRIYLGNRSWEETPERVAADVDVLGNKILYNVNKQLEADHGVPDELALLTIKHANEENAFDKADLAKAIDSFVKDQADALNGKRLVKVELNANLASIQPYDFETKSFKVDTSLFTDRTSYSQEEKAAMDRARRVLVPLKGHLYAKPYRYKYAFTGASSLESLNIADEAVARKIEAARQQASIVVYGHVARVQRPHDKGTPTGEPNTFIQPHFADVVDSSGEILHTVAF